VNCARMNQECVFQPVSSSSSATFVHVSAVAGGIAPGTQLYGAYGQPISTDPHGAAPPPMPPHGAPPHASHHGAGGPPPSGPPGPSHHHAHAGHPPPPYSAPPSAHGPPPAHGQQYPPPPSQPPYYTAPIRSPTDTYSSYADSDAASSSGRRRRRESNEGHERRLPPPTGSEDEQKRRTPVSGSNSPEGGYPYPSQAPMPTPQVARVGAPRSRGHTPPPVSGSAQGHAAPVATSAPTHQSPVAAHPSQASNHSPEAIHATNGSTTPKAAAPSPPQNGGNRVSNLMSLRSVIDSRPSDSTTNDMTSDMLNRLNQGAN
jgi:hypothetical protein